MEIDIEEQFTTIHNYIDLDDMILRKESYISKKDWKNTPINSHEGWKSHMYIGRKEIREKNYSAPHGAGRVMSRREAKRLS